VSAQLFHSYELDGSKLRIVGPPYDSIGSISPARLSARSQNAGQMPRDIVASLGTQARTSKCPYFWPNRLPAALP
jgi:hypothetical protein